MNKTHFNFEDPSVAVDEVKETELHAVILKMFDYIIPRCLILKMEVLKIITPIPLRVVERGFLNTL